MAKVEYRGGIPELRKTGITVAAAFPDSLVVSATGFSFKSYKIPYESMTDVSLVPEGAKKKNYVLNVEYLSNGFPSCVVLTGKEAAALYGSLQKERQKYADHHPSKNTVSAENSAAPTSTDSATEIERFHALMEKGIITEDEFSAKKAQLLNI